VTFASRSEALAFHKDSQDEGYRLSGAELITRNRSLSKIATSSLGGADSLRPQVRTMAAQFGLGTGTQEDFCLLYGTNRSLFRGALSENMVLKGRRRRT